MRKIVLNPPNTALWRRWRRDCERATEDLLAAVARGGDPIILERLYRRRSIKRTYFIAADGPFFGRCVYCETEITDFQRGDVEHHRPKRAVTDEHDNPVWLKDQTGATVRNEDGEPVPHPGYYWLAYDWRNLLPSCQICNQGTSVAGRKIGKHARFPVEGRHAQSPDEIREERPLLINPASGEEDDDPSKHLTIDTSTGVMGHLTERGRLCIEIFGLNLRGQLVRSRLRACREVRALLVEVITNPAGRSQAREELLAIREGKRPYSLAGRTVLEELRPLFVPLFEES